MSLQTNVFENGRWITRNIDPYQARAQNTEPQRKEKTESSSLSLAKEPSLGLVTHTLVRSPVIKWIIPARVRHPHKNDVLFITADSVTIKEARGNYTLQEVATKNDFNSRIRSARILGIPGKLTDEDKYATARINDPSVWEDHRRPKKTEDELYFDGNKRTVPPQIVVLALEANKLVFLCAINGSSNHPQFLCYQQELPAAQSPLEKLGEHIAVDPKSVALRSRADEY